MRRGRRRSSNNGLAPSPVRVAVRVRPSSVPKTDNAADLQHEPASPSCVTAGGSGNTVEFHHRESTSKMFTFDHVFSADSTQKDVYTASLQPLLTSFLNGFNVTVLAYGQTGSGKTYTVGNKTSSMPAASPVQPEDGGGSYRGKKEPHAHMLGEDDGLLPRFLCDLFAALRQEPSVKTIHVSFLEIYCDELRDLLQARSTSHHHSAKYNQLTIREDEHKVWVENLRQLQAENVQKALELLNLGRSRQIVSSNAINNTSSRSHAIYTMEVARKFVNEIKKSKLTFVDLAGSERVKKTRVEGIQMKESIHINVGLSALGHVINTLGDDKAQKRRNSNDGAETAATHVPYRSSKLTRLLRDSLGGNSMTLFIACVSPLKDHSEETLSTLQYANRVRNIQNKVEKNIESLGSPRGNRESERRLQRTASEIEITLLQEQICYLKQQLDMATAAAAAASVVGTNIPSVDHRPADFLQKCASFRDAERSRSAIGVGESSLSSAQTLPSVIPITRVSRIKPPSRSKTMSPKRMPRVPSFQRSQQSELLSVQPSGMESKTSHSDIREEADADLHAGAPGASTNSSSINTPTACYNVPEASSISPIMKFGVSLQESCATQPKSSDSFIAEETDIVLGECAGSSVDESLDFEESDSSDVLDFLSDVVDVFVPDETKMFMRSPAHIDTMGFDSGYPCESIDSNLGILASASPESDGNQDGTGDKRGETSELAIATTETDWEMVWHEACAHISPKTFPSKSKLDEQECPCEVSCKVSTSDTQSHPGPVHMELIAANLQENDIQEGEHNIVPCEDQNTLSDSFHGDIAPGLVQPGLSSEKTRSEKYKHRNSKDETASVIGFKDGEAPLLASRCVVNTNNQEEDPHTNSSIEFRASTPEKSLSNRFRECDNKLKSTTRKPLTRGADAFDDQQPEVSVESLETQEMAAFAVQASNAVSRVSSESTAIKTTRSLASLVLKRELSDPTLRRSTDPESSPVHRATAATVEFVDTNGALEINEHESENWLTPVTECTTSLSDNQADNQGGTPKSYGQPSAAAIEAPGASPPRLESEPDFVLDRPQRLQPLRTLRDFPHRGRMSPTKRTIRPMSIFDFDDSWSKLQQSRPASLERLDTLIKSTKLIMAEEFGVCTNQKEEREHTHMSSATPTVDECLQTMTLYFEKRRRSTLRRGELKHKLRCFEKLLGLSEPLFDENELRVFVPAHQEKVLQQHVDFCEAIVAQRVLKRLLSWREAHFDSCFDSSVLERIFLTRDQYAACDDWLGSKLHDRAYFQQHVLPLVLNGWIGVTPLELETEDAWLAL